ncbi:MFS transporter [Pedobacter lusitanus]|uniref:MFS transporter n=1 Tax=Pedobacter lusitanus TaxID=1503925 RepID=A0A0D0GLN4_9SPHI|nr:MFS transporter [Pedobacter lusitanus]KIO77105.1 MFS transporter [Pedobacter lusitanus]
MSTITKPENYIKSARRANMLNFLLCGLGIATWAPMVPYAKERLAFNDANLGLLLLLMGAGALIMMPVTGLLIRKYGSRKIMLMAIIFVALTLPLLLMMNTPVSMGCILFAFGASIGTIDVAMNAQAIHIERHYTKHIMSSFHGLFSLGGIFGPLLMGGMIKSGLQPVYASCIISILLLTIAISQYKSLLSRDQEPQTAEKTKFSWPGKTVIFLGLMCFIVFLAEGSILDWSAVFLKDIKNFDAAIAGTGYAAFSIAMTVMRLAGDKFVDRISPQKIVLFGSLLSSAGFLITVFSPWGWLTLAGFILVGLGAANIVPVLFSAAGKLKDVSASVALPAVTTMGYAGSLAGPAGIGMIAYFSSLPIAFCCIAALLLLVSISYRQK